MTRENIIELACKSGASVGQWGDSVFTFAHLEAFYKAAQSEALEAAAQKVEYVGKKYAITKEDYAAAIREMIKGLKCSQMKK